MKTMQCPYCGARFEVPETVTVAVCPYCGTTVWQATGELFKEHYMYELRIEYNKAFDIVRSIARRQFAAPDDVYEASQPHAGFVHFVPLYLYHVRVIASCPGNPEAGLEEEYRVVLALKNPPLGLSSTYVFPTRGRKFFEPATLERGKYYQPETDPKEHISVVSEKARRRAYREALNACEDPDVRDETKWVGIVHYPFWEVHYKYGGQLYRSLVDASDGTVVYLEYPIGSRERGILVALGIGSIVASLLIGLGIGAAAGHIAAGAAGGLLGSIPGALASLRLSTSRMGVYKGAG